jgi:adenylate cyclase
LERRLAAILAADVVGYSRLMGEDETGTISALKTLRTNFIEPLIEAHRGRIVKLMGDGLLVEFQSVVDAVECAIGWQTRQNERPGGVSLQFRIGINSGDIVIDEGDIYGDGVNVAARLEGLAEPGGIALSQLVHDQVVGKIHADFEDTGEHSVKNIAKPLRVYRIRLGDDAVVAADDLPKPGLSSKPAIAVLPFDNMSGDPEQDYFADGITEDIIIALSLWRSFPVIARNSSFTYKGQKIDVQRVGRELGARYVLEGSVRRAGKRVRITGQLIDAETGAHVWAERYDRDLVDIFDLQDEIAERIATHMVPEMGRAEEQRAVRKRPADLGAWDLLQRGCWHYHRFTESDMSQARKYMEKSLAIDPLSGLANGYIAATHMFDAVMGWSDDRARSIADGIAAAQRATALDPNEPLPRTVLASLNVFNCEPERGVEEAQRAVELNPSYSVGHLALGYALLFAGRPEEGIEAMHTALNLSPRDPTMTVVWSQLSLAHLLTKDFDAAVEYARKALADNAANITASHRLACALGHQGDLEAAKAALEISRRYLPEPTLAYFEGAYAFTERDTLDFFLNGLRKAGWDG